MAMVIFAFLRTGAPKGLGSWQRSNPEQYSGRRANSVPFTGPCAAVSPVLHQGRSWLRTSGDRLTDELTDARNGLLRFRKHGRKMLPHMRHVVPDLQLHLHAGRLGAFGERLGIIEQRFDGAHLDQERREATEIGMDGRGEGGLRRL